MIGSYWAPVMLGSSQTNPTAQLLLQAFLKWKRQADLLKKKTFKGEKSGQKQKNIISSIYIWYLLSALNTTAAWAEGVLFPPYKGRGSNAMSFAANLTKIVAGGQGLLFCITIWVSKIWFSNFVCTRISGFLSIYNIISYHSLKDIWIRLFFFSDEG